MANRRRTSRTARTPDPYGRRKAENPGGPVTDDDREDARALLEFGWPSTRRRALDDLRLSDHVGGGYDPDRIVRILEAVREILPDVIESWKYWRISRKTAEQQWRKQLFSEECNTCTRSCDGCLESAEALGLKRVEYKNGRRTWHKAKAEDATAPAPRGDGRSASTVTT